MTAEFPTRQVLAKHLEQRASGQLTAGRTAGLATLRTAFLTATNAEAAAESPDSVLFQMVLGLDAAPRRMTVAEVSEFGDPFTSQLLLKGIVPLTLEQLSAAIDALAGGEARPLRKLYAVAEGASFQSTQPRLDMNTRLVITWQKDSVTAPDLLLSTVTSLDDPEALLQLIAWSERQGVFHFFERKKGAWAWAGSSLHALAQETRGKGPFDSHINGGLVMKELRAPWLHWHSMDNSIPRELIFTTPAQREHALFANLAGAEILEAAVRAGVRRWTRRRLTRDLQGDRIENFHQYARQIVWTTSVNLVSSGLLSRRLSSVAELSLPRVFFFDEEGLREVASRFTDVDLIPPHEFTVHSGLYLACLSKLQVRVDDGQPGHSVKGDTEFAFAVPERAFEDQAVLLELMTREVLSPRLALCLLMVDFTNPVFSPERAELLELFPAAIQSGNGGAGLDKAVIEAARAAQHSSPATQLLKYWTDADLAHTVRTLLSDFAAAVQRRLRTEDGVVDLLTLADSRKEAFRRRKLHEFRHTTSVTGAPVPHLAMRPDGTVFEKPSTLGEEVK